MFVSYVSVLTLFRASKLLSGLDENKQMLPVCVLV